MTDEHKGLPVAGYKPAQSQAAIDLVNEGKILEERVLRWFEKVKEGVFAEPNNGVTGFGLAVSGMGQIQIGFMLGFKAVFQPDGSRIALPEDQPASLRGHTSEEAMAPIDPRTGMKDLGNGSAGGEKNEPFYDPHDII